MRLQDTPCWNDPLVHDTICRLQGRWETDRLDRINNNEILQTLMEADALDPVTAAAFVAEAMSIGAEPEEVIPHLPPAVAPLYDLPVLDLLHEPGGTAKLFGEGRAPALKIALAIIIREATGEGLEAGLETFDDEDQERVNTQVGPALVDINRRMTENQSWQYVPQKLFDRYAEGVANIIEKITDAQVIRDLRSSLRIYQQTAEKQREEERKDNTPPQLPADCAYNRLKGAAKRFKL